MEWRASATECGTVVGDHARSGRVDCRLTRGISRLVDLVLVVVVVNGMAVRVSETIQKDIVKKIIVLKYSKSCRNSTGHKS